MSISTSNISNGHTISELVDDRPRVAELAHGSGGADTVLNRAALGMRTYVMVMNALHVFQPNRV